jgi:Ca2+-binding RTX toxin-like protein
MRRAVLLLLAVATVLVVLAGAVVAADSTCDGGGCVGTRGTDTITGSSGDDLIAGLEGNDTINSGFGRDVVYGDEGDDTVTDNGDDRAGEVVYGDEGNDTINVRMTGPLGPGDGDEVHCGPGKRDRVLYDSADTVAKDCEIKRPG